MREYLPPLQLKEHNTNRDSLIEGAVLGGLSRRHHSPGGIHSFAIITRHVTPQIKFKLTAIKVSWLRGSLSADQISAELVNALASEMGAPMDMMFTWMHDRDC